MVEYERLEFQAQFRNFSDVGRGYRSFTSRTFMLLMKLEFNYRNTS